jgi:anti-sigma regulatory factor (Ser/Thr protein kinase)
MTEAHILRIPPVAAGLPEARREARSVAAALGASPEICDAVALVVDELVNNAIEHGSVYRTSESALSVRLGEVAGRLVVEFFDPEMPVPMVRELARALTDAAQGMPSLDSERGRGLFLLSIYMEEVRIDVAEGGGLHLKGRMAAS